MGTTEFEPSELEEILEDVKERGKVEGIVDNISYSRTGRVVMLRLTPEDDSRGLIKRYIVGVLGLEIAEIEISKGDKIYISSMDREVYMRGRTIFLSSSHIFNDSTGIGYGLKE